MYNFLVFVLVFSCPSICLWCVLILERSLVFFEVFLFALFLCVLGFRDELFVVLV